MKRLVFILILPLALVMGCDGAKPEQTESETEPVELKLDYNIIELKLEPDDSNAKPVYYSEITPEGYDVTIRILQGNGGYTLKQTGFTTNYFPNTSIVTEARIVGDDMVVITFKGLLPEEATKENVDSFICIDSYSVTDREGKIQYIDIWCSSFLPGVLL